MGWPIDLTCQWFLATSHINPSYQYWIYVTSYQIRKKFWIFDDQLKITTDYSSNQPCTSKSTMNHTYGNESHGSTTNLTSQK